MEFMLCQNPGFCLQQYDLKVFPYLLILILTNIVCKPTIFLQKIEIFTHSNFRNVQLKG